MRELSSEDRFKAYEAAIYEVAALRREGERGFYRLARTLARVRDEGVYLARFATFERFLTAGVGIPAEEGRKLVRAANVLDEAQASELGRQKVFALMDLPGPELVALFDARFPSKDLQGKPTEKSIFGLSSAELLMHLGGRATRAGSEQDPRTLELASRLQQALEHSGLCGSFAAVEPGPVRELRDASGAVLERRQTVNLVGLDRERLAEVLALLDRALAPQVKPAPRVRRAVARARKAARTR